MKFRTLTCSIAMTMFVALGLVGSARAQTFTSLFSFDGTDGSNPYARLVQATDGNLYGTTDRNGANGGGTVFAVSAAGTLTTVYNFCSQTGCADGGYPVAGLVQATDGDFYGTTPRGGANNSCDEGCGTVFKITAGGTLTTLHSFDGTDGQYAHALVQAANGQFYGTTYLGGAEGRGTIFSIGPTGVLTTLHNFDGTDGEYPDAALIQAANGVFYGTTKAGGANGEGTIFRVTPSGALTTLYSFCSQSGCPDGAYPLAPLLQATDGNFYGTTELGGANTNFLCAGGCGTVFKITPSGTLTTLYSFCSEGEACTDGFAPEAPLIQATDGNFYGTTDVGGPYSFGGTIFSITPTGTLTTLHSFDGDGERLAAALVQETNGTFYGTTVSGGDNNDGTVFSLSVGLGPFVGLLPAAAAVGHQIGILGTNLTGATSVGFNGTAAAFKVSSSSLITATVPSGATSGPVKVATPSGTLTSNMIFRVKP